MIGISNDAILKRILEEYRPYNTYTAFIEGYRAYQTNGNAWSNPYGDDCVDAQAWDRGACAAMRYQQAIAHLDAVPADAADTSPRPSWLEALLAAEGC